MIVRTTPTFVSMVMTLLMMMLAIGCCLGERTTPLKAPLLPLYTRGRRIVDSSGQEVKFYCVNWSGAHMQDYVVGGLHVATIAEISNQIASLGFNCVRLQWSLEMYYNNPPVPYSAVVAMPELAGAKALDAYMLVVQTLAEYNIMTIIDNHVSDANWCCDWRDRNGLWYTDNYPEEMWFDAWKGMTELFRNVPMAVAVDLRNELRPAIVDGTARIPSWGTGDVLTDWQIAANKAANEILAINPNLLVIVQGIYSGKSLTGVVDHPIVLSVPNKLVYSTHDYKWFHPTINWNDESERVYRRYKRTLDKWWGFILEENQPYTAPIWVGEFGTGHDAGSLNYWWKCLLRYMKENDLYFAYWPIDGTQSRGDGREFGAEEGYGILNTTWNGVAYQPHYESILDVMQANPKKTFNN